MAEDPTTHNALRVALASDHAGFELKKSLDAFFRRQNGLDLQDLGTFSTEPVDYPDYAEKIALALLNQKVDRGVLICGSGVGASIAANKFPGIRASVCHDSYSAHQGVEHDRMNILVLGARVIGVKLAEELIESFLCATFSNEERHLRRLWKVHEIEQRYLNCKEAA